MNKNIYVVSTDKPSRLCKSIIGLHLTKKDIISNIFTIANQHIYIISDEEIEGVDWFLPISGTGWKLNTPIKANSTKGYKNKNCKKIILTTDSTLIKDGVQAIDDEFLEWFVNNPSCESVEVLNTELNTDYRSDWKQKFRYKIIILKAKALVVAEGQAEYWPDKVMWVWEGLLKPEPRVTFGKKNNKWLAWSSADNLDDAKNIMYTTSWPYASETKPLPKFTKKEIADKLGVEDFEIVEE